MSKLELKRSIDTKLPMGILSARVAPDSASLIAGCMDGVYLVDLKDRKHKKLYSHESYVSSVAWLEDSNLVVSAGYDGQLCWFDLGSSEEVRRTKVHEFWSWDMSVSPDRKWIASVTGQYLAGGYKYEPRPETEPSVKIVSVESGEVVHQLSHVPSVQSVAFSNDNRWVAAGNLMGEVRVWDVKTGEQVAKWTTPDFTSWGIIKSHCYLGGIFNMKFAPGDQEILLCGMGPMRDPMAGNGKQLWQKWFIGLPGTETEEQADSVRQSKKVGETNKDEAGEGLMETLAVHPDGSQFAMGGRLRGGEWNLAIFEMQSGKRLATLKTGYRITEASYSADGEQLILVGAQGQPKRSKDGKFNDFGRIEVYDART